MTGFIRRYSFDPGLEEIGKIEGVVVIDREPPPADWREDVQRGLGVIASRSESLSRFMSAYARLAKLPPPKLAPLDGFDSTVNFRLRVPIAGMPDQGFVSMSVDIEDAGNITELAGQLQAALVEEFGLDENGNPVVIVEFPDGILRLRAKVQGRADMKAVSQAVKARLSASA